MAEVRDRMAGERLPEGFGSKTPVRVLIELSEVLPAGS